jgi:hypothetical protein
MIVAELSGDKLAAVAAFLSGIGSVLTGWLALRYEAKRSDRNCQERIDAFMKGMEQRETFLQSDKGVLKDE